MGRVPPRRLRPRPRPRPRLRPRPLRTTRPLRPLRPRTKCVRLVPAAAAAPSPPTPTPPSASRLRRLVHSLSFPAASSPQPIRACRSVSSPTTDDSHALAATRPRTARTIAAMAASASVPVTFSRANAWESSPRRRESSSTAKLARIAAFAAAVASLPDDAAIALVSSMRTRTRCGNVLGADFGPAFATFASDSTSDSSRGAFQDA
mmetsp:Transcript_10309/g.42692  ORF Transcript_10309/g.42692 Transcript_10309/m.42692 type:complete len:206 (+) Transcript_10309:630-1247(+)